MPHGSPLRASVGRPAPPTPPTPTHHPPHPCARTHAHNSRARGTGSPPCWQVQEEGCARHRCGAGAGARLGTQRGPSARRAPGARQTNSPGSGRHCWLHARRSDASVAVAGTGSVRGEMLRGEMQQQDAGCHRACPPHATPRQAEMLEGAPASKSLGFASHPTPRANKRTFLQPCPCPRARAWMRSSSSQLPGATGTASVASAGPSLGSSTGEAGVERASCRVQQRARRAPSSAAR